MFVTLFNLQGTHRATCRGGYWWYHRSFPLSRTFFKLFQTFSALSFAGTQFSSRAGLAADSIRIPQAFRFVKHFFKFSKLFSAPGLALPLCFLHFLKRFLPSRKVLAYISKPFPFCQHLFSEIRHFLFCHFPLCPSRKDDVLGNATCGKTSVVIPC